MIDNNKIFAFILWPFGGLISVLKNWRQPWSMNLFWMVCVYMGAIQIFHPEGSVLGDGADGGRYALQLIDMRTRDLSLFNEVIYNITYNEAKDFYQIIVTWIISIFTDNGHVLFTVFALVFGYFYSRNMWYILNKLPIYIDKVVVFFVVLLFLVCPIWQINGVRMWTATHILIYALLPYIMDKDKSHLKWICVVPFVHFSFLYFVVISIIYVFIPRKFTSESVIFRNIILIVFIGSMLLRSINIGTVSSFLESISPESYGDRIELYTADYVIDERSQHAESVNWYVTASSSIEFWVINVLLIFCACGFRNKEQDNLLYYCLLISSIANIASQIPSGARFLVYSHIYAYVYIIWRLALFDKSVLRKTAQISVFPLLITLIFSIRESLDYYGVSLICGNFVTTLVWDNNVSIINLIK